MKKKIHCSIICCCSAFFYIVFSYKWSIRFFSVFFSSHFLNCYLTPTQSLLGLLLNFNFLDCHVWVHCRCLLQFSRNFSISFFESILIMLEIPTWNKNLYCPTWNNNLFWFFYFSSNFSYLDCFSQSFVMIDWIAVTLNGDLLFYTSLNNAITFGLVL